MSRELFALVAATTLFVVFVVVPLVCDVVLQIGVK